MALKAGRVGVNPNYVDKEGRPLYDNSYLKELLRKEGIITLFTKEGNPISIDNAVAGRVYDLTVIMSPKQAGTGTPSPTNVRAISGFDSITVSVNSADTEVSFDSTVYGGVLDVSTGVLTVTYVLVDLGDLTWGKSTTGNKFYTNLSTPYKWTVNLDILCSAYKFDGVGNSTRGYYGEDKTFRYYWIGSGEVASELYIADEDHDTAEAFAAAVAGYTLCYKLATPSTVQLTPAQIALVTGSNTVTSTTGTSLDIQYLGTLVPGGDNGRSLNRSLNLNREVIDGDEKKEIQEKIKEVPVEEPVTTKKSTKKSTK